MIERHPYSTDRVEAANYFETDTQLPDGGVAQMNGCLISWLDSKGTNGGAKVEDVLSAVVCRLDFIQSTRAGASVLCGIENKLTAIIEQLRAYEGEIEV